ncbi:hypothetical protein Bca101_091706 [Brassica carinata]
MSTLRAFTRSYIVVLPDSPLPGRPNQRSYIYNQAANPFTPSASTSENDQQRQRDTTVNTTIRFPDKNPYNLRVPGLRPMQATGSLTKVHPASGFLDESLYNLRSHPRTYGFQKDVSLNLKILGEHA